MLRGTACINVGQTFVQLSFPDLEFTWSFGLTFTRCSLTAEVIWAAHHGLHPGSFISRKVADLQASDGKTLLSQQKQNSLVGVVAAMTKITPNKRSCSRIRRLNEKSDEVPWFQQPEVIWDQKSPIYFFKSRLEADSLVPSIVKVMAGWVYSKQWATASFEIPPGKAKGRDIFLGERCRYFLNSLSTAYVTWASHLHPIELHKSWAMWGFQMLSASEEDEQRPGIKLRWPAAWEPFQESSQRGLDREIEWDQT